MKRKVSTTPTRIWTFGLRAPKTAEDEAYIREQLLLAHRYQNVLVEIERERRTAFRAARTELSPELESLEKRVKELSAAIDVQRQEIKSLRKQTRERTVHKAAKGTLDLLKVERRTAADSLKTCRAAVNTDSKLRERAQAINDAAQARVRDARGKCGVYWGTYLLIEKAMESASKSGDDPQFRRFRGEGRVGVQIQKGMTVKALFSRMDTRLRMEELPAEVFQSRSLRRRSRSVLEIRIGSVGRAPKFAVFDSLKQHRPLPEDGLIKWAWMKLERVGPDFRWYFQIALESPSFADRVHVPATDEAVAINVGWRQKSDGSLRVAYCIGTDGVEREITLPPEMRERLLTVEKLRSESDLLFGVARHATGAWLKAYPLESEELRTFTEHILLWQGHAKLARLTHEVLKLYWSPADALALYSEWELDRRAQHKDLFDTPDAIDTWLLVRNVEDPRRRHSFYLKLWKEKNDALWRKEARLRKRTLGWRKEIYRIQAARLARAYKTLLIEKFDLRRTAERPLPESEAVHIAGAAHNRTLAAPSELRSALIAAFHGSHVEQSADHNTLACKTCGTVTDELPSEKLVIKCPGCGSEHDQDRNNCDNQLARYRGEYLGPAPKAAE